MNKFRSCDKNLTNTLSIKSEIDIKEEQLESYEGYLAENDQKLGSVNHQRECSEICTDVLHLEKACGSHFGKIEVKQEETFDEVYIHDGISGDIDYDFKADIDVKNEDIEDLMEDKSCNLNNASLKRNIVGAKRGTANEQREMKEIFDSPSPTSSTIQNGKSKIIDHKNEEREEEGKKIKDFESRKRIKLDAKFECSLCEYKTNRKGNLKKHSLIHSPEKLFKCSDCDYGCNEKRCLEIHLLSHSNTKLFKCSECGYECNRKGHLKIHILSHSNTKLFKCSECGYECNRKCDLNRHLLLHSNTKFFKCSECDYECKLKSNLRPHLLTHSIRDGWKNFCIKK